MKTRKISRVNSNSVILKEFIKKMFSFQTTLKMMHWSTKKYYIHKIIDQQMTTILPLIDAFVENYLGEKNMSLIQHAVKTVTIHKISSKRDLIEYLEKTNKYLSTLPDNNGGSIVNK